MWVIFLTNFYFPPLKIYFRIFNIGYLNLMVENMKSLVRNTIRIATTTARWHTYRHTHQKNHNPYIYIYLYLKFSEKCECGARFLNNKNLTRHQNESCLLLPTESPGLGGHISTPVSGLPVASTQGLFFCRLGLVHNIIIFFEFY